MENFSSIIGQENAKKLLFLALKNDKIAHGYLFIGPPNLGKFKMAAEFAKALQCQDKINPHPQKATAVIPQVNGLNSREAGSGQSHARKGVGVNFFACGKCRHCSLIESRTNPDVLFVEPIKSKGADGSPAEEKTISIDQVREIEHHLSLFPYDSKYKIAVVNQAHKFSEQAANAFLKTLEEPRGNSVIILIAENDRFLPKTLVSRVQKIRFNPVADKIIENSMVKRGLSASEAREIAFLAANSPELAVEFYGNADAMADYKETIKNFHRFFNGSLLEKFSFAEIFAKDSAKAAAILGIWLIYSHKLLSDSAISGKEPETKKLARFLSVGGKILKLINASNVNTRLAMETLALEI